MSVTAKRRIGPTRKVVTEELLAVVKQGGPLIIDGRYLRCPGCENVQDVLAYVPLEYSEKYAEQVIPPLKCTIEGCKHVFALRP